jgi:hypothetical protein
VQRSSHIPNIQSSNQKVWSSSKSPMDRTRSWRVPARRTSHHTSHVTRHTSHVTRHRAGQGRAGQGGGGATPTGEVGQHKRGGERVRRLKHGDSFERILHLTANRLINRRFAVHTRPILFEFAQFGVGLQTLHLFGRVIGACAGRNARAAVQHLHTHNKSKLT